eukprot:NODE_927_length_1084_cov_134.396135_g760_i0.p2 GENE.NODE_927_length_1084_cov_134.396135_g760_i0~~NODE_927_length_1084_cov_134.396135_g760_i0.p2  ORF type:complete len:278 (+),score=19.27 NODE_927_length_1084_cov_134.396135_g760_i0:81-914(+)
MGRPPLPPAEEEMFQAKKVEIRRKCPELEKFPDDYVWHFLKARGYDVDAALKMWTDQNAWRQSEQIENVLNEYFPPDANKIYPCGYHGRDKRGNVIRIERPGLSDPSSAFQKFDVSSALRWHVVIMETGRRTFESYLGGTGDGVTVIMDMAGVGMKHMDRKALGFVKTIAALDHATYPEFLRQVFIVNASSIFTGLYKLISPFIDPNTRAKVQILGDKFLPTLSQFIDPGQLPDFLGGGCRSCGAGGCLSLSRFGGQDPNQPYLRIPSRFAPPTKGS